MPADERKVEDIYPSDNFAPGAYARKDHDAVPVLKDTDPVPSGVNPATEDSDAQLGMDDT
ncbi:hypothetical protein EJ06DRAFT_532124 [Trichodelitschia bisporula]|uniref:Uncharacterized protein n=1 Tax=Trichodelitschia bisporula TaxID=703511 RepID=A0A6G1HRK8_9PEZI|nr:hypothetical protein EJ06DRAFT_532124 [Trichodelitschia bisporula]